MFPSNNNNIIYENNPNIISSNYYTDDNSLVYHNTNANLFSAATSSLTYFPASPFNYYDTDYFFLEPCQHLPLEETAKTTTTKTTEVNEMSKADNSTATKVIHVESKKRSTTVPRKRTSKKDRHSKINTAKGPRDRRMRLSLEIARDFFGLQDMLGFDKASTTVEWLLTKAKHDIKKLFTNSIPVDRLIHTVDSSSVVLGAKSASSTSECEVISGIIDHRDKPTSKRGTTTTNQKTKHKEGKKPVLRPIRTRDMREKAREKARERTKVKTCAKTNAVLVEESNQVGSSRNPLLQIEKPMSAQEGEYIGAPINIMDNVDDHSFDMMGKWSPVRIFSHLQGRTEEEHQFEDFQFYDKPWDDSYNIQNLL